MEYGAFSWGSQLESVAGAKYGYMFHPNYMSWWWPPALGTASSAKTAALPRGNQPGDVDGRVYGLPQAIWDIERGNYDIMLLTETNISDTV